VDIFRIQSICNSLAYSPNGEFLATALNNCVGILLWMNKTLFGHVSLIPLAGDYEPPLIGSQNSIPPPGK